MTQAQSLGRLPHRPVALLLDFDGVILDSAEIKTLAFGEVYGDEDADKVAAVLAYQREHGGISRREKFRYFEQEIFHRHATADRIEDLSARFSEIAFRRVLAAPFVNGAEDFVQKVYRSTCLFVISGTPQEELTRIVEARGLSLYFRDVVGAPTEKRDAFSSILKEQEIEPRDALAVGDSVTEWHAARGLGIPFLGILDPRHPSKFGEDVPTMQGLVGLADALAL